MTRKSVENLNPGQAGRKGLYRRSLFASNHSDNTQDAETASEQRVSRVSGVSQGWRGSERTPSKIHKNRSEVQKLLNQKIKETIKYMKDKDFIENSYSEEELAEYLGWIMYNKPNVIKWIFQFFDIQTHPENPERLSLVSGSIQAISERRVKEFLASINYEVGLKRLRTKKYIHGLFRKVELRRLISLKVITLTPKYFFSRSYKFCNNTFRLRLFVSARLAEDHLAKAIKFLFQVKMENLPFYSVDLDLDEREIEEVGMRRHKLDYQQLLAYAIDSIFQRVQTRDHSLYSTEVEKQLSVLKEQSPRDLNGIAHKFLSVVLLTKYIDVSNPLFLTTKQLDDSTINEDLFFANVVDKKRAALQRVINFFSSVPRSLLLSVHSPFSNPFKRNRLIFNRLLKYLDQFMLIQIVLPSYFFSHYVAFPPDPKLTIQCAQFRTKATLTFAVTFDFNQIFVLKTFLLHHLEDFIISRSLSPPLARLLTVFTHPLLVPIYLRGSDRLSLCQLLRSLDPCFSFSHFLLYLILSDRVLRRLDCASPPRLLKPNKSFPFIIESILRVSHLPIKGNKKIKFLSILVSDWLGSSYALSKITAALKFMITGKSHPHSKVLIRDIQQLSFPHIILQLLLVLRGVRNRSRAAEPAPKEAARGECFPSRKKYFWLAKPGILRSIRLKRVESIEHCSFPIRTKSGLKLLVSVKKVPKCSVFRGFSHPVLLCWISRGKWLDLLLFSPLDLSSVFKLPPTGSLKDPVHVSRLQEVFSFLGTL